MAQTGKRTRTRSEVGNQLQGLVTMSDSTRLENEVAQKLNLSAQKARTTINNLVRRVSKTNGILASRSKVTMNLILDEIVRIKPAIGELVNELRERITYKSGKTGRRENSWIRDLMAGIPRKHVDGYYAYVQVSEDKAKEICVSLGVDLPTEVEAPASA